MSTYLTSRQRRLVEQRASEKGFTCYFCGSSDSEAPSFADSGLGGYINVIMECADCGEGTQKVSFTGEEARTVLRVDHQRNIRDFPEADGSR